MRKRWFGDSRDYVKWSCVRQQASGGFTVLYGAMLRPDGFDGKPDSRVTEFFDQVKDFGSLKTLFPGRFHVEDAVYETLAADRYFDRIVERMTDIQREGKVLVFLDPDTGIEPRGKTRDEHLRLQDVRRICAHLRQGDKLVVYQHALHTRGWVAGFEER